MEDIAPNCWVYWGLDIDCWVAVASWPVTDSPAEIVRADAEADRYLARDNPQADQQLFHQLHTPSHHPLGLFHQDSLNQVLVERHQDRCCSFYNCACVAKDPMVAGMLLKIEKRFVLSISYK